MLRVLHYGLSENRGGIETYLYKIVSHINKNEFQMSFIDMNIGETALKSELTQLGCCFYKITPRKISILKNYYELESLFKTEMFDIFHCHLNTLSYILPIKLALKYKCKVIVHSRNSGAAYQIHTLILHYFHFLTLPRKKITMLAVSDKAGKWLFGRNTNYTILNNGIESQIYKFDSKIRAKLRKELQIENRFVIGVIGAFLPAKNQIFALRIFSELLKINSKCTLILIGDGPLKKTIETNCKLDNVLFLGNRTDVNFLYNALDVLLMPSLFEGFPNVCLEAQTNGLPCIVSDVITKEVDLTGMKYLSLNLAPDKWAVYLNEMLLLNNEKRNSAVDIIIEKGFDVTNEIERIERIYIELKETNNKG